MGSAGGRGGLAPGGARDGAGRGPDDSRALGWGWSPAWQPRAELVTRLASSYTRGLKAHHPPLPFPALPSFSSGVLSPVFFLLLFFKFLSA